MPAYSEDEKRRSSPCDTESHYRLYIQPHDNVVVVGCSPTVFMDPTLLLVSYMLGDKGKVFIADPKETSASVLPDGQQQIELENIVGPVEGEGNVNNYREELHLLQEAYSLADPKWLGEKSGMLSIPKPDGFFDAVVDHTTSFYIARTMRGKVSTYDTYTLIQRAFREYQRVLKPGGRLLFQGNMEMYELTQPYVTWDIPNMLEEAGFSVTYRQLEDEIFLPAASLTPEITAVMRREAVGMDWGKELMYKLTTPQSREDGALWVYFVPYYHAPDLFVGIKR